MIGVVDWQEDTLLNWGDRAMWGTKEEWRKYQYAAHGLMFPDQISNLIIAFSTIYSGYDSSLWVVRIEPAINKLWYEVYVYTNDLDWRALNRLHGDILPDGTYYIFANSKMGLKPIPYVKTGNEIDDAVY